MFRISRRLDYGVQLMVALANEDKNTPKPTARLAESLDIPLPFLHQIGHTLMQAGLIKASPGPRGGLRLNQDPEEITLLRIAESLEGPICLNSCLNSSDECEKYEACSSREMWGELQEQIVEYLSNVTLFALARDKEKETAE